jgi:hypothetical protein
MIAKMTSVYASNPSAHQYKPDTKNDCGADVTRQARGKARNISCFNDPVVSSVPQTHGLGATRCAQPKKLFFPA